MQRSVVVALVLGLVLLAVPSSSGAQTIGVAPPGWDFGDVALGDMETIVFTLESLGPVPLTIHSYSILDDASSSFALDPDFPGPIILLPGETFPVDVTFSPTALGLHTADLRVESDAAPPDNDLRLPLRGVGVVPEPTTALLLACALLGLRVRRRRH
jgi:hypothetical protein